MVFFSSFARTVTSVLLAQAFLGSMSIATDTVGSSVPSNQDADSVVSEERSGAGDSKVGVLLLNLGGPETLDDVEDPDIIQLPGPMKLFQKPIARFISSRRAPKSQAAYQRIGGGSPILKYTNAQAKLLEESLKEHYGLQVQTYIGMRYWKPFTEDAIQAIHDDGIDSLVILPLYPHFSVATSGSSLRVLHQEFASNPSLLENMKHTVIPSYFDRPGYVMAVSNLVQKELDSFSEAEIAQAKQESPKMPPLHVLFSAHGVPNSYIEAGDPYQEHIIESVERIKATLMQTHSEEDLQVHLSYQSRVGPIEWLRPYTDDVIPQLAESGVRNLVVVPISFVSEHIETLEEIDLEYRELAESAGVSNWRRCPALNTDETFIKDLADLVSSALAEPPQTVVEVCLANKVGGFDGQQEGGYGVIVAIIIVCLSVVWRLASKRNGTPTNSNA